jgi:hypothetical protein
MVKRSNIKMGASDSNSKKYVSEITKLVSAAVPEL